jgi:hypothetical protein
MLNISPQTLDAWRKKNLIPHISIRYVIRFDPARVLAALEKLETKAVAP